MQDWKSEHCKDNSFMSHLLAHASYWQYITFHLGSADHLHCKTAFIRLVFKVCYGFFFSPCQKYDKETLLAKYFFPRKLCRRFLSWTYLLYTLTSIILFSRRCLHYWGHTQPYGSSVNAIDYSLYIYTELTLRVTGATNIISDFISIQSLFPLPFALLLIFTHSEGSITHATMLLKFKWKV